MNLRESWQLFALGSAFFAGLTALFGKLGVSAINSNLATFIRTVIILAITAGILSIRNEWERPSLITPNTWLFLFLSALATGFSWLCYYRALQLGPVSKVAPIDKLSVVFAILFGVMFIGERLTFPAAIGGLLIISGTIMIVLF
jgi:bacterial/archaeal transporter family protein